MKRIKIFTLILFCCSAVAFAGCKLYERVMTDHQAPVISGGEEPLQISVADTEDKLLEGMTAEDDRDGDVTDSLVVQEISGFETAYYTRQAVIIREEGEAVGSDDGGHVSRA